MANLRASKPKELSYTELKWNCDLDKLEFESTKGIKPIEGTVGQERALKALKLGVDLKSPGYNVFVTGLSGTGKFSTIRDMLEKIRPVCPELKDYLYVSNFKDNDRPILLELKAGSGKSFKIDIAGTVKFLQNQIPQELEREPFVSKRKDLIAIFGDKQNVLMGDFEKKIAKDGFTIGKVKSGESERPEVLPVIDGKPVYITQLEDFVRTKLLTRQKAKNLTKKYSEYQQEMGKIIKQSIALNKEFQDELENIEDEAVTLVIKGAVENLKEKYPEECVQKFMISFEESLFDNLDAFKIKPGMRNEAEQEYYNAILSDYEVNLLLDNSGTKECPVLIETSPTYQNLFGTIEKVYDGQGGWHADFTKIKAGAILRANGGYLVINAMDAYQEPGVWKTLKRVLMYGKLEIQDVSNLFYFSPSILKPEPIEINTKIILIGNNEIYSILSAYENDFNKIFKVKAEFDHVMPLTDNAIIEYARVIKKLVETEELLEFTKCGIAKIAEFGARYAGRKDKLTTRFAYIADLVRESSFSAKDVGDSEVTEYHVARAFNNSKERHGLYESKMSELYADGTFLLDTEGSRVGQINGLAVYGSGIYNFGKPSRITASVSLGNGSIINVEREAGLSGKTHNKGMLILTGYFRETFGKQIPLSFNASVVFEQGYGPIDGDSATITEVSALLSCLSEIPIKQSLAITGSVNQKGDIQPIGGVNEKIEGFFDVCKQRGLNKKQGVIIPIQNVNDLMLDDEVVEAVKNNEFHIYPVSRVEEAVEILTGVRAGKLLKNGRYQANTVFGLVDKTLREMRRKISPPAKKAESPAKKPKTTTSKRKK